MESVNKHFVVYRHNLPSYEDFYNNIMKKNIMCLFGEELTRQWKCKQEWIRNGSIDFDYLDFHYGKFTSLIYNCNETYFNSNPVQKWTISQYVDYWRTVIQNKHNYSGSLPVLYLKDWHFFNDTKAYDYYQVPVYFESDFLNEYCLDKNLTDYRFVYMGPKSSSTPIHIDVFGSFSWSANVHGVKKWLVIPPDKVKELKKIFNDEIPNDLYSVANFAEISKIVEAFEVIQKSGEVLFVPSGYMHQVMNLEDTISINHNWFNSCNLKQIYSNLLQANSEVQNQLSDLKNCLSEEEWIENCDKLMIMHFGQKLSDLIDILQHIAIRLRRETKLSFRFENDLEVVEQIAGEMKNNGEFARFTEQIDRILAIIKSIQKV